LKKFFLLTSFVFLICGCCLRTLPTTPNTKAIHQTGDAEVINLFTRLFGMNDRIAIEVARLPEYQKQTGVPQKLALERFVIIFENSSYSEAVNLDRLLKFGIPEVRRYSAFLQAIFWILEKSDDGNVLTYSWKELLDKAWDFSDPRWADFDAVTDRLNQPRLIDYYEKKIFQYTLDVDKPWSARHLFGTHRGSCAEITVFSLICLKKAGYQASAYDPKIYDKNFPWPHLTVMFKGKNGVLYILDDGRPDKRGITPFNEYRRNPPGNS
jgi:hypothetical protein